MKTYIVHLNARRVGEGRTFCGLRTADVECLPEDDHLSPSERLCGRCASASQNRTSGSL